MTEAIRSWLTRIEATRVALEALAAADDYEDVLQTEDHLKRIDEPFAGIQEAQTVSIQSQPGCLKLARYKPAAWRGVVACIHMHPCLVYLTTPLQSISSHLPLQCCMCMVNKPFTAVPCRCSLNVPLASTGEALSNTARQDPSGRAVPLAQPRYGPSAALFTHPQLRAGHSALLSAHTPSCLAPLPCILPASPCIPGQLFHHSQSGDSDTPCCA